MATCPDCGHASIGSPFCTECGAQLDADATPASVDLSAETSWGPMKSFEVKKGPYCIECRTHHPQSSKFCPRTGVDLVSEQKAPPQVLEPPEETHQAPAPHKTRREEIPPAVPPTVAEQPETRAEADPVKEEPRPVPAAEPASRKPEKESGTSLWVRSRGPTRTTLLVMHETREPERHFIHKEMIVGRGDSCDLSFSGDEHVSPKHARFFYDRQSLKVEDLESLNGVYIRIRRNAWLEDRDRIQIGRHIFRFEIVRRSKEDEREATRIQSEPGTSVLGTQGDSATARLIIRLESGLRGKEYFIGTKPILIGRGGGSHNFMADDRISQQHAKIVPHENGGFLLEDLKSTTGTWRQIRGTASLLDGDQLLIGMQRLAVKYEA